MAVEINDITGALEIFVGICLCVAGGLYVERTFVLLMFIMITLVLYAIVYNTNLIKDFESTFWI